MHNLTYRQAQVLAFLRDYQDENGMPPTRAEIARHFEFSSCNSAEEHLQTLRDKGYIELIPAISRGIRIVPRVPANV